MTHRHVPADGPARGLRFQQSEGLVRSRPPSGELTTISQQIRDVAEGHGDLDHKGVWARGREFPRDRERLVGECSGWLVLAHVVQVIGEVPEREGESATECVWARGGKLSIDRERLAGQRPRVIVLADIAQVNGEVVERHREVAAEGVGTRGGKLPIDREGLPGEGSSLLVLTAIAQLTGEVGERRGQIATEGVWPCGHEIAIDRRGLLGQCPRLLMVADIAEVIGYVVERTGQLRTKHVGGSGMSGVPAMGTRLGQSAEHGDGGFAGAKCFVESSQTVEASGAIPEDAGETRLELGMSGRYRTQERCRLVERRQGGLGLPDVALPAPNLFEDFDELDLLADALNHSAPAVSRPQLRHLQGELAQGDRLRGQVRPRLEHDRALVFGRGVGQGFGEQAAYRITSLDGHAQRRLDPMDEVSPERPGEPGGVRGVPARQPGEDDERRSRPVLVGPVAASRAPISCAVSGPSEPDVWPTVSASSSTLARLASSTSSRVAAGDCARDSDPAREEDRQRSGEVVVERVDAAELRALSDYDAFKHGDHRQSARLATSEASRGCEQDETVHDDGTVTTCGATYMGGLCDTRPG
jgi:hypothetical protein